MIDSIIIDGEEFDATYVENPEMATCEPQKEEDKKWCSEYEKDQSVKSVTMTVSTGSATKSTSVFFNRKSQKNKKTTIVK